MVLGTRLTAGRQRARRFRWSVWVGVVDSCTGLAARQQCEHAQNTKCYGNPKQNPKAEPDPGTKSVGIKQLCTSLAAKPSLAAEDEDKRHENTADKLRRDWVILRSRNLMAGAHFSAIWAF